MTLLSVHKMAAGFEKEVEVIRSLIIKKIRLIVVRVFDEFAVMSMQRRSECGKMRLVTRST